VGVGEGLVNAEGDGVFKGFSGFRIITKFKADGAEVDEGGDVARADVEDHFVKFSCGTVAF